MVFIWSVIALAFLLLELGNPGLFFFLSFSCGAGFSAAFSMLQPEPSLVTQIITFFAGSTLAFIALSRWVKKTSAHSPKTNVYALQGKRGTVITSITPTESGSVKIGGETWSARAAHEHETIALGAQVEIVTVRGVHLIVKEVQK